MNTIIQCAKADLMAMWCEQWEQMQEEADKRAETKATEMLLEEEQAKEMLKISTTTLWRWGKSGYLKPIYIGGKHKRYRRSDIMALIERGGAR